MPIYEYACQSCGNEFEALVRSDTLPECPGCHSTQLEKLLSVFATSASTPDRAPALSGPCGGCGNPNDPALRFPVRRKVGMVDPQATRSLRTLLETRPVAALATLHRGEPDDVAARTAYLARFPGAAETFGLGDFSVVALQPVSARLVAGFGRAYSLVGDPLIDWLQLFWWPGALSQEAKARVGCFGHGDSYSGRDSPPTAGGSAVRPTAPHLVASAPSAGHLARQECWGRLTPTGWAESNP